MIAYVLRETGRDPAWLIGAPVPQLGSNAGSGEAGWSSRRTSRIGRRSRCRPRSRSSRTSSSTITPSTRRSPSSRRSSNAGSRPCRRSSATRRRTTASSALPGEHNRANAGAASRRSSSSASHATRRRRRSRGSREPVGGSRCTSAGGVTVVDDYGHHPDRGRGRHRGGARALSRARLRVLFQPHLYSRTRHLAPEFADALAAADDIDGHRRLPGARGAHRQASPESSIVESSPTAASSPAGCRPSSRGLRVLDRRAQAGRRAARRWARATSTARRSFASWLGRVMAEENVALARLHDDRHRRAGALVRAARIGRRARRAALDGRAAGT